MQTRMAHASRLGQFKVKKLHRMSGCNWLSSAIVWYQGALLLPAWRLVGNKCLFIKHLVVVLALAYNNTAWGVIQAKPGHWSWSWISWGFLQVRDFNYEHCAVRVSVQILSGGWGVGWFPPKGGGMVWDFDMLATLQVQHIKLKALFYFCIICFMLVMLFKTMLWSLFYNSWIK